MRQSVLDKIRLQICNRQRILSSMEISKDPQNFKNLRSKSIFFTHFLKIMTQKMKTTDRIQPRKQLAKFYLQSKLLTKILRLGILNLVMIALILILKMMTTQFWQLWPSLRFNLVPCLRERKEICEVIDSLDLAMFVKINIPMWHL